MTEVHVQLQMHDMCLEWSPVHSLPGGLGVPASSRKLEILQFTGVQAWSTVCAKKVLLEAGVESL